MYFYLGVYKNPILLPLYVIFLNTQGALTPRLCGGDDSGDGAGVMTQIPSGVSYRGFIRFLVEELIFSTLKED